MLAISKSDSTRYLEELLKPIYITYSYDDGFLVALRILAIVLILAIFNVIVASIFNAKTRDRLIIFWTNILVKSPIVFMWFILPFYEGRRSAFPVVVPLAIVTIAIILVEGIIYLKILTSEKFSGMFMSLLCNIGAILFLVLFLFLSDHVNQDFLYAAFLYGVLSAAIASFTNITTKNRLVVLAINTLVCILTIILFNTLQIIGKTPGETSLIVWLLMGVSVMAIEGLIYRKVIISKKFTGIKMSLLCNIGAALFFVLIMFLMDQANVHWHNIY